MRLLSPRHLAGTLTLTAIATASAGAQAEARTREQPEVSWRLSAPSGKLQAIVSGRRGGLSLEVRRGRRKVLSTPLMTVPAQATISRRHSARAGRVAASRHQSARARRIARRAMVDVDRDRRVETFRTPSGKRREHRFDANALTLRFAGGRRLELLAASDGIAYRLPGRRDRTTWSAPRGTAAWMQPFSSNYERAYEATPLSSAPPGDYGFPALLRTGSGTYALLTEAGLQRSQAASRMTVPPRQRGTLRLTLTEGERRERTSAWRVAVVGQLSTVVESDLPLSLGRPSEITDPSWITPGRSTWSWWSDSWSPRHLHRQQEFVDFAAEQGFEYTLIDDGFDPAWVPEICEYARRRGVRLILWTHWRDLSSAPERRETLDLWNSWGIAGIKVDFLHSDSGRRMAVMEDIARAAAERRMVVNFHGTTIPRGLERTWPNVLTMEGVVGAETYKSGTAIAPRHNVTLAFTRNVIGAMDYTPVTFSAGARVTSAGHELAQSVVFQSGIQHYADSPASYRRNPAALEVLRDVPAAWDETEFVSGAPDSHVTLARRAGETWFVGSLHAGEPRTTYVPLRRFLPPKRSYDARITADDNSGRLTVTSRKVTSDDVLAIPSGLNGGSVVILTPVT